MWIASLLSNFGTLIQGVGAAWLMTSLAPSADMVALVQVSTVLPIMLFSLPAGAAADVWDRRIVMLVAQGVMLAVSVALAGLAWLGLVTPWLLIALTFLLGTGAALHGPAWQSSVREQVPRPDLPAAVALNSVSFNLARGRAGARRGDRRLGRRPGRVRGQRRLVPGPHRRPPLVEAADPEGRASP